MHKKLVCSISILMINAAMLASEYPKKDESIHWLIADARLLRKPIAITKNGDGYFPASIQFTYRDRDNKLCVGGLHIDVIDHDAVEHIIKNLDNSVYQHRISSLKKKHEQYEKEDKEDKNLHWPDAPRWLIRDLLYGKTIQNEVEELNRHQIVKNILTRDKQHEPMITTSWKAFVAEHPQFEAELLRSYYSHAIHRIRQYIPNPRIAIYRLAEASEQI